MGKEQDIGTQIRGQVFDSPQALGVAAGIVGLLGLVPAPVVTPVGDQHPGGHHAEDADKPEQAAADHAQRRSVGLGSQYQSVAHGRDGHLIFIDRHHPG